MITAEVAAGEPIELSDVPVLRIQPSQGWTRLGLREVWAFRELLYFLTWRDIKVRYKQSVLGAAWAIIQPLVSMVVFTFVFSMLAGLEADGNSDYKIWNITALVPWTFFATGLTMASNSLVGSQNLIKKIYFPRLVIPTASVLSGFVDFVLAFAIVLVMMPFFGLLPTAKLLLLPAFLAIAFMIALGAGLWLSALNVQFRDVRFTVPFMVQIWMYATPIVYSLYETENVDGLFGLSARSIQMVWAVNPMVGVVEGFRWAVGVGPPEVGLPVHLLTISAISAAVVFVGGMFYFRRMEKTFADVV